MCAGLYTSVRIYFVRYERRRRRYKIIIIANPTTANTYISIRSCAAAAAAAATMNIIYYMIIIVIRIRLLVNNVFAEKKKKSPLCLRCVGGLSFAKNKISSSCTVKSRDDKTTKTGQREYFMDSYRYVRKIRTRSLGERVGKKKHDAFKIISNAISILFMYRCSFLRFIQIID